MFDSFAEMNCVWRRCPMSVKTIQDGLGRPEGNAVPVLFTASDEALHVTSSVIAV